VHFMSPQTLEERGRGLSTADPKGIKEKMNVTVTGEEREKPQGKNSTCVFPEGTTDKDLFTCRKGGFGEEK